MNSTATAEGELTSSGRWRRYWPLALMICGFTLFAAAIGLGNYLAGRIVLFGPLDATYVVAGLAATAVCCIAAALIGCVAKIARGRFGEALAILVAGAIFLGAMGLSTLIALAVPAVLGVDPRYELSVPGSSSQYIVATSTFGETAVALYRGDGTVYTRVDDPLPLAARSGSFEQSHRVETDASGDSFLVYPQEAGGEARVFLP